MTARGQARRPQLGNSSTEGAKYGSQGQARSEAKCVAPGLSRMIVGSTESAKYHSRYSALSELHRLVVLSQGRRASRLPLAVIFRTFGA